MEITNFNLSSSSITIWGTLNKYSLLQPSIKSLRFPLKGTANPIPSAKIGRSTKNIWNKGWLVADFHCKKLMILVAKISRKYLLRNKVLLSREVRSTPAQWDRKEISQLFSKIEEFSQQPMACTKPIMWILTWLLKK